MTQRLIKKNFRARDNYFVDPSAGTSLTGTTETALGSDVIPANYLKPRQGFRITAGGLVNGDAASELSFRVRIGPAATALGSRTLLSGTFQFTDPADLNIFWYLEGMYFVRTGGSAGVITGNGNLNTGLATVLFNSVADVYTSIDMTQ